MVKNSHPFWWIYLALCSFLFNKYSKTFFANHAQRMHVCKGMRRSP